MVKTFSIRGRFVDIPGRNIYPAELLVEDGKIISITPVETRSQDAADEFGEGYILPGFVDAHVHIESSMLVPAEFARMAVVHGTVATVSDPHEIANVCGLKGVEYMIENGKTVPFKFHFGAPSCVPATIFETAGDALDSSLVEGLLRHEDIYYLAEMMNFPGVLSRDPEVMKKIESAHRLGKPVDGHAPGLRGEDARNYIRAGISTDHECFTREEALEKLGYGMKILIREGSAAKNFEELVGLLPEHFENMMFCSDDKHPDSLEAGHINQLCARAVAKGIDWYKVLQAACINPVVHYGMRNGLLRAEDPADFIIVKDLVGFEVMKTYIDGLLVAENGKSLINTPNSDIINKFNSPAKEPDDFAVPAFTSEPLPVIEALDGQLITRRLLLKPLIKNGNFVSDPERDLLKIVVVNRYRQAPVAKAFIKNFGLKLGALASSVAHDSHNIVAVGVDDKSLCDAVNLVIGERGGIAAVIPGKEIVLPLPVAGLMSVEDGYRVSEAYKALDVMAKKDMGSSLGSPFMTLSFMALLVIPELKLSDLGLFDGARFQFEIGWDPGASRPA